MSSLEFLRGQGVHPWQGSNTKQYEQIGNAVPPLMPQRAGEAPARHPAGREAGVT